MTAADDTSPRDAAAERAAASRPLSALGSPLSIMLGVGLAIGVLIGLNQIAAFVTPIFLGLNLVLAIAPFMHWMIRKRVPRILAMLVAAITIYVILIVFVALLIWSVYALIQELPKYGHAFNDLYRWLLDLSASIGITQDQLFAQLQSLLSPSAITSALSSTLSNFGSVLSLVGTAVVVIFFLFFDSISFEPRMDHLRKVRSSVALAFDSFSAGVARYWIVTTVFGLIVAVLDVVALEILQVPLALVWGVFSFLTNYIPNIGFVIGLVPPVLMALLANGPVSALIVLIVWSLLNFVIQTLIQPKFAGDAVGVTPTVSFLSLIVWAFALGPVGALLALPATLLVKALLVDADPERRWVNLIIASKPDVEPAEDEARHIFAPDPERRMFDRGAGPDTATAPEPGPSAP